MREPEAAAGCFRRPHSSDGSMNSMTLPNISKRLYMRVGRTLVHTSDCLNFASIKNPHPFRGDCIVSPDH